MPKRPIGDLKRKVLVFERKVLVQCLAKNRGNRTRTAQQLGITRRGLLMKMRRHKLPKGKRGRPPVRRAY